MIGRLWCIAALLGLLVRAGNDYIQGIQGRADLKVSLKYCLDLEACLLLDSVIINKQPFFSWTAGFQPYYMLFSNGNLKASI